MERSQAKAGVLDARAPRRSETREGRRYRGLAVGIRSPAVEVALHGHAAVVASTGLHVVPAMRGIARVGRGLAACVGAPADQGVVGERDSAGVVAAGRKLSEGTRCGRCGRRGGATPGLSRGRRMRDATRRGRLDSVADRTVRAVPSRRLNDSARLTSFATREREAPERAGVR